MIWWLYVKIKDYLIENCDKFKKFWKLRRLNCVYDSFWNLSKIINNLVINLEIVIKYERYGVIIYVYVNFNEYFYVIFDWRIPLVVFKSKWLIDIFLIIILIITDIMSTSSKDESVKVAIRIRPLNKREIELKSAICVSSTDNVLTIKK